MASPLTNFQEPGFFSRIQESPSLFLTPGSVQVVGLLGTGKSTKTVTDSLTRGTGNYDLLSGPVSSFNSASSNAVFRYPQSSFAAAHLGSVDLSTLTYPSGPDTLTIKVTVDGEAEETVTFVTPANAAALVSQLNSAMSNVTAELDAGNRMLIYVSGTGLDGKSFVMGAGTANTLLGFVTAERAKYIRWDPAVTDPEFAPQNPEEYQLSYETPKVAADFGPKQFFGLRQVVAEYGDISASNTLSLGAQGAFGNGASIVTCRQLDPASLAAAASAKSEIIDALTDLEDFDVSIIVPMVALNAKIGVTAIGVDDEYLNHVSKMSSRLERKERICVLGVDERAGRLDILGPSDTWQSTMSGLQPPLSSGLESRRVMVVNPGRLLTSSRGVVIESDGTYAAACLAGRMVNAEFDEAEPMTRKTLATIDELILPDLSRPEKNSLTSLGVTVLEPKSSLILVRRAVTADGSSIARQEPSIVRAFDRVAGELREALENRFVGQKILTTTGTALEAATSVFLERLIAEEIITSYRNVRAEQNSVEPRQFDISFEAVPVFPFIWGLIDISIQLS
jgi:hypothetical protein